MKMIVIVLTIFSIFSCKMEQNEKLSNDCIEKIKPDIVCTAQYDPVCGCNMKTYGNACEAGAASIRVLYNGECKNN
jgi:Kazal-type serine protease inhibitor domain